MESRTVRSILQWCKTQGIWATKMHGSIYSTGGMPDLLLLVPTERWPIPVFLECKEPYHYARPLQRKRLEDLRQAGAYVAVVHSLAEAQKFIEETKILTSI